MKNGFYNLNDQSYFALEMPSNSFISRFFDYSPLHAVTGLPDTKSKKIGSLFHAYLLENDFDKQYEVINVTDKRSKEYKDLTKNSKKEIILKKEIEELKKIKKNLDNFTIQGVKFEPILKLSKKEITVIFDYIFLDDYRIQCKSKIDLLYNSKIPIIFDIKSTRDCTKFEKSIYDFKYYRQDAFYSNAIKNITGENPIFMFIAIETIPPYGIMNFQITPEYKALGAKEVAQGMMKYRDWDKKLTSYPHDINYIGPPPWAK